MEYRIQGHNYVVSLYGAVLCKTASGKSKYKQILTAGIRCVVFYFNFFIYQKHIMLLTKWLANATFVTAARNPFLGGEDIKPLFVLFTGSSGPSITKQCRKRQDAQLCCFCHLECPKCIRWGGGGFGQESCLKLAEILSVCIVCCFG